MYWYTSLKTKKSLKLLSNIKINNEKVKQPRESRRRKVLLMLERSWSYWLRETIEKEVVTRDVTRLHTSAQKQDVCTIISSSGGRSAS